MAGVGDVFSFIDEDGDDGDALLPVAPRKKKHHGKRGPSFMDSLVGGLPARGKRAKAAPKPPVPPKPSAAERAAAREKAAAKATLKAFAKTAAKNEDAAAFLAAAHAFAGTSKAKANRLCAVVGAMRTLLQA